MSYEAIKSLILTLLIGTSIFLSFILWTYQPNYKQIYDTSYVNEANVGGREILKSELIKPQHILFKKRDEVYGFEKPLLKNNFYEEMTNWTFYEYKESSVEDEDDLNHHIEILYPLQISSELLSNMFTFNDNINLPSWSFDKISMTLDEQKHTMEMAIYSVDNRRKITATVDKLEVFEFLQSYFYDLTDLIQYIDVNEDDEKQPIFIPKDTIEMQKKTLVISQIEPELFVNALFSNPNVVTPNRKEAYFTDGQRGMRIVHDDNGLEFIHPIQTTFERNDLLSLLDKSVEHINDHKGWTNNFLLDDYISINNELIFRLHHDGYSLFDYHHLTTIQEVWRNQQLYRYHRPLYRLDNVLSNKKENLPSSEELIGYLKQSESYEFNKINDIKIGYYVQFLHDSHSVSLEPNWFILYENDWKKLSIEDIQSATELGVGY